MSVCTFFGHRDTPGYIKSELETVLINLIEKEKVKNFYIGNQGRFDSMCLSVLNELKKTHNEIEVIIVLAYIPTNKKDYYDDTVKIISDGIEKIPKRFAISFRNDWMIENSNYVICFVERNFGGAAKFMLKAEKKIKRSLTLQKKSKRMCFIQTFLYTHLHFLST